MIDAILAQTWNDRMTLSGSDWAEVDWEEDERQKLWRVRRPGPLWHPAPARVAKLVAREWLRPIFAGTNFARKGVNYHEEA
jgi:hypothetical protein